MADAFTSCKDVQIAMGDEWKHGCNHRDVLLHIANHLFFTVRFSTNHSNSILVLPRWLAFPHIANIRHPVASKLSYKHEKIIALYPDNLE